MSAGHAAEGFAPADILAELEAMASGETTNQPLPDILPVSANRAPIKAPISITSRKATGADPAKSLTISSAVKGRSRSSCFGDWLGSDRPAHTFASTYSRRSSHFQ